MTVVLAIDALEYDLVERFGCRNLMQRHYGKTDISEFSEPRTMVLWASFMAGRNMESEVLSRGDRGMWDYQMDAGDTFFKLFDAPAVIDLPGFSYDREQHRRERELLKRYFDAGDGPEKDEIKKEYDRHSFAHHAKVREEFLGALSDGHDLVLGYFSVADVIGHLSFGDTTLMRMIYKDLDEIAARIEDEYIVLSDHGMKPIGMFGDHSDHGFWSSGNRDFGRPRITDFSRLVGRQC